MGSDAFDEVEQIRVECEQLTVVVVELLAAAVERTLDLLHKVPRQNNDPRLRMVGDVVANLSLAIDVVRRVPEASPAPSEVRGMTDGQD